MWLILKKFKLIDRYAIPFQFSFNREKGKKSHIEYATIFGAILTVMAETMAWAFFIQQVYRMYSYEEDDIKINTAFNDYKDAPYLDMQDLKIIPQFHWDRTDAKLSAFKDVLIDGYDPDYKAFMEIDVEKLRRYIMPYTSIRIRDLGPDGSVVDKHW